MAKEAQKSPKMKKLHFRCEITSGGKIKAYILYFIYFHFNRQSINSKG